MRKFSSYPAAAGSLGTPLGASATTLKEKGEGKVINRKAKFSCQPNMLLRDLKAFKVFHWLNCVARLVF